MRCAQWLSVISPSWVQLIYEFGLRCVKTSSLITQQSLVVVLHWTEKTMGILLYPSKASFFPSFILFSCCHLASCPSIFSINEKIEISLKDVRGRTSISNQDVYFFNWMLIKATLIDILIGKFIRRLKGSVLEMNQESITAQMCTFTPYKLCSHPPC